MKIRQLAVATLPALAAIILAGCGQDTGGDAQPEADAPDITAEVQEHYRTKVSLPPEIWEKHVLKHTENNVYNLQRLRAVNKGFRETIDARVMAIIETIQQHESRCTPP